jgi:hypothetical protein
MACRGTTPETSAAPIAMPLAILPKAGKPAVMRDGQHGDHGFGEFVMNREREALQNATVHAIFVARPDAASFGEIIDCFESLGSKSVGREQAALSVPQKGFADVGFGLGQDRDGEARHSKCRRALASLQGTGCVAPA